MNLGHGFDFGFNTAQGSGVGGGANSGIAPYLFPVAVAGRGFLVDTSIEKFRRYSRAPQRVQTDQNTRPGQQTLSNEDLWPRTQESFHKGAGQTSMELEDADPYRFFASQGVDVWTRNQLTLLNDTTLEVAATGANQTVISTLTHLAFVRSSGVVFYDGATWGSAAALGGTAGPATSDGTSVYVAVAGDVKKVTTGGTVTTDWSPGTGMEALAFAKGRLMAGSGRVLYDLKPGVAAAAHFTQPWTGWVWRAFCDGPSAVYAAGDVGDRSMIYRVPLKADGTGLDAPVVAGRLPDGELVTAITSYLGYFVIGTTKGVRFAVPDANGDLTLGALIPTSSAVRALEPQDRFVWFAWSDFDSGFTGLGRLDLSAFVDQLTPAYASDLMYAGTGTVSSIATWGDKRWFTVNSTGLVGEADVPTSSGWIDLSATDYGISDRKVAQFIDVKHDPIKGAVQLWLDKDDKGFTPIATSSVLDSTGATFELTNVEGERFTVRLVLEYGEGPAPVVRRVRLRAHPLPTRSSIFELPCLINDVLDLDGSNIARSVSDDASFLIGLVDNGRATTLQMGTESFVVYPADYEWLPSRPSSDHTGWQGVLVIQLREVTDG